MKTLKQNLFLFLPFLFIASLIVYSCKDNPQTSDESKCGSPNTFSIRWPGPNFSGYVPDTYTLGSERYFNFFKEIDSICTDVHINSFFSAYAFNIPPERPMKFRAAVEWALFFERSDTGSMSLNGNTWDWSVRIDGVGLKQAFGTNAGSVFVNIYVHFPTLGTEAEDRAFLADHVGECAIQTNYNFHKPGSPAADNNSINEDSYKYLTFISDESEGNMINDISIIIPMATSGNKISTIPIKTKGIEGFNFKIF